MRTLLLLGPAALCLAATAPAADGDVPGWANGIRLNIPLTEKGTKEFDGKPLDGLLAVSDPAVWKFVADEAGNEFLRLEYDRKKYKSTYAPKHRSPVHIALLKVAPLSDFVMDVELMSTTETYGHQDLCIFFGFESPEKYYYAHLAPTPDANAHNVFVVNNAPRKNLLEPQKKGVTWKADTWHTVRLVRRASTGLIEVYFDDLTKPVLKAEDKTFASGFVGFGSFDDTGRFRRVKLYTDIRNGKLTVGGKQAEFFKPLGK
jgi:hypothetical protein